ncbi:chemotaxis-specific protein-glutamate methyltransferase CheB [Acidisoma cellulosilytica]|uniref:Protein-glutamate methylesterase/protein-glutamine glutaminase n=1 Tax=Acidisoma cellulosilyticum TaxID=2802395 RepID=A0A963Z6Z4_9PROT|nr:chemotaxis-specific protein-glutamate methyltransferase CheB [Acidisoma cellulosilyticum]MCB8883661.1 chemotaxis-specific protein-glutamate methyltransferase CheB [Acidisoma cellulosilyticum]
MIRLLIVDDSPLMRRLLVGIFAMEDFVVETARDGIEAIEKLHQFRPDVVTLDINMPVLDGLACLDRIMLERPCPVVMVSSLTEEGAAETLDALAMGAVDFVPKPRGPLSLAIDQIAPLLLDRVRAASTAKLSQTRRLAERVRLRASGMPAVSRRPNIAAISPMRSQPLPAGDRLVLVGSSTGGPAALETVLTALPGDFPWPIVIAQHMPESFTGPLARRLNGLCALEIEEVSRPVTLSPGHAYIGRGDADLIVTRWAGELRAMAAPKDPARPWHPSTDRLVETAMANVSPDRLVGVLMTGMGNDGAETLTRLHHLGGVTIAEAEESAVVWGMPGSLVRMGGAGRVVPLSYIATELKIMARTE